MKNPLYDPESPNEFAVVGENKEDPTQLLLIGPDGNYYAYSLPAGDTQEVDPDDGWEVELTSPEELFG